MSKCKSWFIYRWKQILASVFIVAGVASTGSVVGWSVAVEKIAQDPDLPFNITLTEQRWLVSCVGVASLVTTLLSGLMVEAVGPCALYTFLLLPMGIAWILMAGSYSLPWLFVGRVITGGFGVLLTTIIQPLIAELCQPDVRGMLSTLPDLSVSFGLLVIYVFTRFLPWDVSTLICGLLLIPALFVALFVPESPYWLLRKGKEREAKRSLMRLRAADHDVDEEIAIIKQGLVDLDGEKGTFLKQLKALKDGSNSRPIILLTFVFLIKEMAGGPFIFMYSAFFFSQAGVTWDPFTCTVLVGVTRLAFTFILALIIDKVGRRPLLIFSSLVCACTMFVIGAVVDVDNPNIQWIPLVCALIFVACFSLGVGPVPWILIGELLPTPVRSLGASICTFTFALFLFTFSEFWPSIVDVAGLDDVVFSFGGLNLCLALLVWLFLPETRNRSLEDLQTAFAGAAMQPFNKSRSGYLQAYGSTITTLNNDQLKKS